MLRLEKELECNAAEQIDAYRMHSSGRSSDLLEAYCRTAASSQKCQFWQLKF